MKKSSWLWIISGIIIGLNVLVYFTHWVGGKWLLFISDFLPVLCSLIAVASLFLAYSGFKKWDKTKLAWLFILLGILLDFFAEVTYAILEIAFKVDMNEIFPSYADFFWCCGYIPVFIGLLILYNGFRRSGLLLGNSKIVIKFAPVALIVFALVTYLILIPILRDPETRGISKFFYLYYPVGDMLIVIPAAILMYITSMFGKGAVSMPWRLLALGFISFTVGDLIYSYLSWLDLYGSGNLLDLCYNGGYLLIALAGIYQRELIKSL